MEPPKLPIISPEDARQSPGRARTAAPASPTDGLESSSYRLCPLCGECLRRWREPVPADPRDIELRAACTSPTCLYEY